MEQALSMTEKPITVAVVGHANSGKTSLMRTLLRDSGFGEISEHPGTTRHVEGGALLVEGRPVLELFDTPGLEDSIGLLELLEQTPPGQDVDGIERLRQFVNQQGKHPEFNQEAKVIRQLLHSDVVFYVIDTREPVLGKYRDELKVIGFAARPVIPVLNFTGADPARLSGWKDQLSRLGLHATIEFDTVAFNIEDEKRLYQKIQSLLEARYEQIQFLIDSRQQHWAQTATAAAKIIANLFVNVASYRLEVEGNQHAMRAGVSRMQDLVRESEANTVKDVLGLFRFTPDDVDAGELPVDSGQWKLDLFDPAALKEFGIKAGGDVARGGAIGAGIDILTGGLSLGLATALGAAAGLLWSTARRYGRDLAATVQGCRQLCVSENTLKVLWFRQIQLLHALLGRGHAAHDPIQLNNEGELPPLWASWLIQLRNHGQWSALGRGTAARNDGRENLVHSIANILLPPS
jgi:hypothetical protein